MHCAIPVPHQSMPVAPWSQSLKWLFANDTALKAPYEKSLAAMIHEPTFAGNIKKGLFHDIKFIHHLGNVAVHGDQTRTTDAGLPIK